MPIPVGTEPKNALNLIGRRFGRLIVTGKRIGEFKKWICQCDCGNMTTACSRELAISEKVSCGCYFREVRAHIGKKHQMTLYFPKEYQVWRDIRARRNPDNRDYTPASFHAEWEDPLQFLEDVGAAPERDSRLMRIDFDGDWEPDNVQWFTKSEALKRALSRRYTDG